MTHWKRKKRTNKVFGKRDSTVGRESLQSEWEEGVK